MRPPRAWKLSGWPAAALGAIGLALLVVSAIVGGIWNFSEPVSTVSTDQTLSQMKNEVQDQLVEAAKRHALAEKHRTQALKLSNVAEEEREKSRLLKAQSLLARRQEKFDKASKEVREARAAMKKNERHSSKLSSDAQEAKAKADADKEKIMELEDKAGNFNEKAMEEADKIKVVEQAESKAAADLPTLLVKAKKDESQATSLKEDAKDRIADSQKKVEAAKKLDQLAEQKEQEAHTIRNKLMSVLEEKAKTLDKKERDANAEAKLAKEAAQKAAEKAQEYADEASKDSLIAQKQTGSHSDDNELEVVQPEDPMQKLHKLAESKRRHEKDVNDQVDHKQLHSVRAANLEKAAQETERRKSIQAESPEGNKQLKEDGHFSKREEAFKKALASAYRAGYVGQHRVAELQASSNVKPARTQMLGEESSANSEDVPFGTGDPRVAMLSKGPGEASQLDKVKSSDKAAPIFSMLWSDPGSLKDVTRDLSGTTKRLRRIAPRSSRDGSMSTPHLYEDGHESRAEDAFKRDMRKYNHALKEERRAELAKVSRLNQELAELPGGDSGDRRRSDQSSDFEERRQRDWRLQAKHARDTMLRETQNHWDSRGKGSLTGMQRRGIREEPRVVENEEGHLVFDRRSHSREEDRSRHDGSLRSEVHDLKDDLRFEKRRDRRLEDRTSRLEGEVDELKEELRGGRMTELNQVRAERRPRRESERREERRRDEDERAREEHRREMARRRVRGYHQRSAAKKQTNFSPDAVYEKEYAWDPGHVSRGEIKFQHALKNFDHTKAILRQGAMQDMQHMHLPELVPAHLPGQGL